MKSETVTQGLKIFVWNYEVSIVNVKNVSNSFNNLDETEIRTNMLSFRL